MSDAMRDALAAASARDGIERRLAALEDKRMNPELHDLLVRISDFLDDQADAEYFTDSPAPVPNEAMRLKTELDQLITTLGRGR